MRSLREVRDSLLAREKKRIAVAAAEDRPVLEAVKEAVQMGIAEATLCGDEAKIRQIAEEIELDVNKVTIVNEPDIRKTAEAAVKLVHNGEAQLVMKGLIGTADFLRAVLNKEWGLRTDSLLSHVMVYEADFYPKLLVTTDGGMNIAPNYEQKVKILKNAIKATEPLGLETIKVCALAAKEKVNPKMQATVDAKELEDACKNGEFGENVIVEGPLAFDLAVSKEACEVKGFKTEVGGDVDIILMPTIEVGNGIGKAFTYAAGAKSAGIIMGAKAPIVLVSRADTHESKLYSIAYGAIVAAHKK